MKLTNFDIWPSIFYCHAGGSWGCIFRNWSATSWFFFIPTAYLGNITSMLHLKEFNSNWRHYTFNYPNLSFRFSDSDISICYHLLKNIK